MSFLGSTYFVKRAFRLFGKRPWVVSFNGTDLASFPEREAAVAMAVEEAKRSTGFGRSSEVRVDDGEGFMLLQSSRPGEASEEELRPEAEREPDGSDDSSLF